MTGRLQQKPQHRANAHKAVRQRNDQRKLLRTAAAKVHNSLKDPFRQMSSDEIMAFIRPKT